MTFDERAYYSAFKRVRNQFRKYDPMELVTLAIRYAGQGSTREEKAGRHPWLMMLLVKWVLTDDNAHQTRRPPPSDTDFLKIAHAALKMGDHVRMPNSYDSLPLFFRSLAYQQFLYQHEFSAPDFARQFVLFGDLPTNSRINLKFRDTTGLDTYEFLQFSLCLVIGFITSTNYRLERGWFKHMDIDNLQEKTTAFLDCLALSPDDLKDFLTNASGERLSSEYYEQTPLIKKPLFKNGGTYLYYHPAVLSRGLEHFVYDRLGNLNKNEFQNSFGPVFESHVANVVQTYPGPVETEKELKGRKPKGKLVDFILSDGDVKIYIDAKAVSGTHMSMTSHLSNIVRGAIKNSALKAVEQALDVNQWDQQTSANLGGDDNAPKSFLIVVTYKELYLGNGETFKEIVTPQVVESLYKKYSNTETLPINHIYFMSISSFERLVHCIAEGHIGLAEALAKARDADADPRQRKFEFMQHLQSFGIPLQGHPIIKERLKRELGHIKNQIRNPR